MKPTMKWMRTLLSSDAFETYYAGIVRKGGVGLPSAQEAKRDLELARRATEPRFPL